MFLLTTAIIAAQAAWTQDAGNDKAYMVKLTVVMKVPAGSAALKPNKIGFQIIDEKLADEKAEEVIVKTPGKFDSEWSAKIHGNIFSLEFSNVKIPQDGTVFIKMICDAAWNGKPVKSPIYSLSLKLDTSKAKDGVIDLGDVKIPLKL
jgi:hypothetical protein